MLAGLATIAPPMVVAVHIVAQTVFRTRNARACTRSLCRSSAKQAGLHFLRLQDLAQALGYLLRCCLQVAHTFMCPAHVRQSQRLARCLRAVRQLAEMQPLLFCLRQGPMLLLRAQGYQSSRVLERRLPARDWLCWLAQLASCCEVLEYRRDDGKIRPEAASGLRQALLMSC
jgi:hypothetical protein